jgi:glutamate racemase
VHAKIAGSAEAPIQNPRPEMLSFSRNPRIGLFDSGVGGLSVLQAVARELPGADLVYFADQKYCPYGPRAPQEIRALSRRIVRFLLERDCGVIVVACNTASAAALYDLRETSPQIPIVGMEPAVKPAALASRSGKVAVLATRGTLAGELFANTRAEYARDVKVLTVYPNDWVELVERGEIDSADANKSVRRVIEPLVADGIDEIALGCTHYPFLAPVIENFVQGKAVIVDPSEAVARRTAQIVHANQEYETDSRAGRHTFFTSGEPNQFARVLHKLTGIRAPVQNVLEEG